MMTISDLRPLHRRALALSGTVIARVRPGDLTRPTPCAGWNLGTLLGHVIGQNHGFADAIATPDAALAAFADRPPDPGSVLELWQASADRINDAAAAAPLDRRVLLVEISRGTRFPVGTAVGFHLLDTVVHTWDIATALGEVFRPDAELVGATLTGARQVPDGPASLRPDALFAPGLPHDGTDPWRLALALLGRRDPHIGDSHYERPT